MHVEPGMHPTAQHSRSLWRQKTLPDQKREHPRPEQFLQRPEADIGHDVEQARAQEEPVGHQGVQVGMKVEVFAEGMDGHDDAGLAVGKIQRSARVFKQALVSDVA